MKILITGYRGFIGQNMVQALKDEHELTLIEKDDPIPDFRDHDWVIHLGANSSTTETNVERIMKENYEFSCELLSKAILWDVSFQFASSASIYGSNKEFSETSPVFPQSPYSWTKYLFERYMKDRLAYYNRPDILVIQAFRYFNVYGPGEEHKGNQASPFHKFERQARENGVIKLFHGSHHYFRDFVPVEQVIDVHKKFFKIKQSGIWNLGTGQVRSFKSVAEEIASKYNARIEYIDMPESVRNQYQTYTCADITKLQETLNEKDSS
jgi:ADP-L-glycero-D-manno-heptose 6-epimerase